MAVSTGHHPISRPRKQAYFNCRTLVMKEQHVHHSHDNQSISRTINASSEQQVLLRPPGGGHPVSSNALPPSPPSSLLPCHSHPWHIRVPCPDTVYSPPKDGQYHLELYTTHWGWSWESTRRHYSRKKTQCKSTKTLQCSVMLRSLGGITSVSFVFTLPLYTW